MKSIPPKSVPQKKVRISFLVDCHTVWGQQVFIVGSHPLLGSWDPDKALKLHYLSGDEWGGEIIFPAKNKIEFEYKYIIKLDSGAVIWESGNNRKISIHSESRSIQYIDIRDFWQIPSDPDTLLLSAPFTDVIFRRPKNSIGTVKPDKSAAENPEVVVRLQVMAPRCSADHALCVVGSIPALGEWNTDMAALMCSSRYPLWTLDLNLKETDMPFSYKYVIKDKQGRLVEYETGSDHFVSGIRNYYGVEFFKPHHEEDRVVVVTDNKFRHHKSWRGAGVAIPVFSLRTNSDLGVGEFLDLKMLVDWCAQAGMQAVQILPINDTSVNMSWLDSYPYSGMSVFALHPLYLNIEALGPAPRRIVQEIENQRRILNASDSLNYEEVMAVKLRLARTLFEIYCGKLLLSAQYQKFVRENAFWLEPYAAFCFLRDLNKTSDYTKWGVNSRPTEKDIKTLVSPDSKDFDKVAFYYFLQYNLHKQFKEASDYAKQKRVVLKGDVPIGINKFSDSCWTRPELFYMDQSAGAPPDPFSEDGQNWGFPTYNWYQMARENFQWWRRRLSLMADCIQMIRLDHVLGFFRIWEIPDYSVSGLMGHFNPAIPLWRDELEREGIWDFKRLTEPYITQELLDRLFCGLAGEAAEKYLDDPENGQFSLKAEYKTQRQIETYFAAIENQTASETEKNETVKKGLMSLASNIILFRDPEKDGFHPRINMMKTYSFECLDEWLKHKLINFYNDYFYRRQDEFWREQAMIKLPFLKNASRMLICGEDLGMIPGCVSSVMEELCLLGLRIQRMPRESDREFGLPHQYGYLTVCTTSSHDMSTLRGWWEEDPAKIQRYYNNVLGHYGQAPKICEPWIVQEIILRHLESPSMWAIFPMQDILGMSGELRRGGDPKDEQINNPANSHHYWKFRLHMPLEKLIAQKNFNNQIKTMITDTGRY